MDTYIEFGWAVDYEDMMAFCTEKGVRHRAPNDVCKLITPHLPAGMRCYRFDNQDPNLPDNEVCFDLVLLRCRSASLAELVHIDPKVIKAGRKFVLEEFGITHDPRYFPAEN